MNDINKGSVFKDVAVSTPTTLVLGLDTNVSASKGLLVDATLTSDIGGDQQALTEDSLPDDGLFSQPEIIAGISIVPVVLLMAGIAVCMLRQYGGNCCLKAAAVRKR